MKTLSKILTQSSLYLTELLSKTQNLQRLDRLFQFFIDDKILARHCHVAKLDEGKLFLIVDNSAWATKLHYAIPDILKSLNAQPEFKGTKKIRYSVVPQECQPKTKVKKHKGQMSKANKKLWQETLKALKKKGSGLEL